MTKHDMTYSIYRLICPVCKKTVYIGRTSKPLEFRLSQHNKNVYRCRIKELVDKLKKLDLELSIELIKKVDGHSESIREEAALIREQGKLTKLLNRYHNYETQKMKRLKANLK
jgi:hypothetical protein